MEIKIKKVNGFQKFFGSYGHSTIIIINNKKLNWTYDVDELTFEEIAFLKGNLDKNKDLIPLGWARCINYAYRVAMEEYKQT